MANPDPVNNAELLAPKHNAQIIFYNGQQLEYNRLTFTQMPRLDTDGRSVMYMETTYTFSGVIYDTPANLTARLLKLRKDLAVPGMDLYISEMNVAAGHGDQAIKDFLANTEDLSGWTYDVNWGPIPGVFQVTELPGGSLALYQWTVTVYEPPGRDEDEGDPATQFFGDHEGFTFSSSYAVDQDGFNTRTIQGKLTVSFDYLPADQYRDAVFTRFKLPGTEWRRLSQVSQLSEDQRVMGFAIQDREVLAALPVPVTAGEATFTTAIIPYTYLVEFALAGTFSAGRTTDKKAVYNAILALAASKIPGWNEIIGGGIFVGGPNVTMVKGFTITESLYLTNEISFRISGQWLWNANLTTPQEPMFAAPPSKGKAPTIAGPHGNASDSHVYYSKDLNEPHADPASVDLLPLSQKKQITGGEGASDGNMPDKAGGSTGGTSGGSAATSTSSPTPTVDPAANLSDDQKTAPYISFNEVISYDFDAGVAVLLPKETSVAPFVQQTRPRRLIITQAGYAIRYDEEPKAPKHIYPPAQCASVRDTIDRSVPQPLSPWVMQHQIAWCYMMHYVSTGTPDLSLAVVPNDPRTTTPLSNELVFQDGTTRLPVA